MDTIKQTVNVDARQLVDILAPITAASLTTALYTAELVRLQEGGERSAEAQRIEVLKIWTELTTQIQKLMGSAGDQK